MPYIPPHRREDMDLGITPSDPGELNYVLSRAIKQYIEYHGLRYRTLNDIVGVLAALSMEVYRRLAAPYEDDRLHLNGDVFDEAGE